MTDVLRVRVAGPLGSFAVGFAAELVAQGYAVQPAAQQLRLMAHVSRWLAAEGVQAAALNANQRGDGRGVRHLAPRGWLLEPLDQRRVAAVVGISAGTRRRR